MSDVITFWFFFSLLKLRTSWLMPSKRSLGIFHTIYLNKVWKIAIQVFQKYSKSIQAYLGGKVWLSGNSSQRFSQVSHVTTTHVKHVQKPRSRSSSPSSDDDDKDSRMFSSWQRWQPDKWGLGKIHFSVSLIYLNSEVATFVRDSANLQW